MQNQYSRQIAKSTASHKLVWGFTLVELLVVISIIAVLLAVLMPVLARSRQIAYRVICLSNLRQLGLATETYTQSYKYYPLCIPSSITETWSDFLANPDIAKNKMLGVPVSLWPFHKNKKLYDCPVLSKLSCEISYCYNWQAGRDYNVDETAFASVGPSDMPPISPEKKANLLLINPEKVKSPDIFVLLYDLPIKPEPFSSNDIGYDPYRDIDPDDFDSNADPNTKSDLPGLLWEYKGLNAFGPHNKSDDILFADGHVKTHKKWSDSEMRRNPN